MHKESKESEQETMAFPGIDFIQVEIDGESHRIDFESACFVRSLAGSFLDVQGGSTSLSPLNLVGKNMAKIENLTVSLQLDSANFLQIMNKLATVLDSTSKDEQVQLIGEIAQLLTDSVVVKPSLQNKLDSIEERLKRMASDLSTVARAAQLELHSGLPMRITPNHPESSPS